MHKFNHDFSCILAIFAVSLFTREWIEMEDLGAAGVKALMSPSLRGSGLKLLCSQCHEAVHGLPLYEGVD